jgi:Glyoxalase-like domain
MSNTIIGLSIDAAALAGFWAEAPGREVAAGAEKGYAVVTIGPVAVSVPRLVFHQVPEGKTVAPRARPSRTGCTSIWPPPTGRPKSAG